MRKNLPCGCFFNRRILVRVCEEHTKPTNWEQVRQYLCEKVNEAKSSYHNFASECCNV